MELMRGYRTTEVGLIPEDWEAKQIGDLKPFVTSGSRGWAAFYSDRGAPFIRITNLSRGSIYLDLEDLRLVNLPEDDTEAGRTHLQDGDVLISITADIGIVGYVSPKVPKPAYINQHIALVRFDSSKANSKFVSYFLASETPQRLLRALTDSGAKAGMSLTTVQKIQVALPPTRAEQEAIAAALSDADALIESLEQLIAKKRHLKQGAMQDLLSPKDGWNTKKLLVIAPLQRGFDLPNRLLKRGPYPVVYSNGILNHHEHFMVNGPGVVTGRSGTLGVVQFLTVDFWPHNTTLWVTDFKGNEPKFIYYLYCQIGLQQFGTGSGVPTLNRNDVHDFSASIPNNSSEQVRIAAILSDMDAEIAALESKLAKARLIKQGMMHNLLTGRIRLV